MTDTIDPNRGIIGGTVREHIQQLETALATSEAARVKAEAALGEVPDHDALCHLSRVFCMVAGPSTQQESRINEWLKGLIARAALGETP